MAPKSKVQFEEIRIERSKQIMQAALEVFATHGYHGASISHIASIAEISKGSIYTYFESKEDILKAIISKGIKDMIDVFKPALNEKLTPALLKKLLTDFFQLLQNNLAFWRLYFSISLQPQVYEMIEKELAAASGQYSHLLFEYYKSQGSKNPEAESQINHALLDGITLNFLMNHHEIDMRTIASYAIEQILKPRYI